MNCCAKDQDTPFCAYCGREIAPGDPRQTLLAHIVQNVNKYQRSIEKNKKRNETGSFDYGRAIERDATALAKWDGWRAWVSEQSS